MSLGDLVGISTSQGVRAYDNGDGTFTLQVQTTTGIPTSSVVARYTAVVPWVNPAPGANAGDIIQSISNYNTTTGALLSVSWQNITQGTTLAGPPLATDITPQATTNPYGTQFFNYQAIAATGAAVAIGDIVQRGANFDLITNAPVNTWVNITKGTTLTGANVPPIGTLTSVETLAGQKYLSAQYFYTVANAFGGNNVGDTMSRYDVINGTTLPPTLISTSWTNVTTGAPYLGPVSYTDLNAGQNPPANISTAGLINVTGAGTTLAGLYQVSFANIGAANATVAGTTLYPGTSLDYVAPNGGTIDPIAYDATGTTLAIASLI
jgi:hypothetical protein